LTYRKKLLGAFALVTNGISLGVMYGLSHHYMFDGYRAKMLSIVCSVASMIDAEALKTIQTRADESTSAYQQLRHELRQVRDANQRKDTYMKRMFTVMASKEDPTVVLIGVDAEESLQGSSYPGDVYRAANRVPIDMKQAQAESSYITDDFGTFLRAYAPVKDHSGNLVGAVVVEAPADWVQSVMRPLLFSGLGSLFLAALIAVPVAGFLSNRASQPLTELHGAVDAIGKGEFGTRLQVKTNDEFGLVAQAINGMAMGLGERDRVKSAFARYVSQQVLDSVLKSDGSAIQLSGDRRQISVLFSDIRGFSTMSENLPPEKVVKLLNEYFERMVDVIFRNKGTLDKFIGDGLMVIFGAPEDDAYQEEHALRTALEMQHELELMAVNWEAEGIRIRVGIGINSGPAVVGNIGSSRRMEYTAIGDTVNLASRLESATKDFGVGILVSEYTYNAVRGAFPFKPMGAVQVRGRSEPVLAYSLGESPIA
jgi:adenylate cyclase